MSSISKSLQHGVTRRDLLRSAALGSAGLALSLGGWLPESVMAQGSGSTRIVDFSTPAATAGWSPVNDDVMGGISSSRFRHEPDGYAVFEGTLSVENNGGFASVRGSIDRRVLEGATGLSVRVRGDGQRYQLRLRMGRAFDGVAYVADFDTVDGEWITVSLALRSFEPSFRGYRPRNAPVLEASEIRQIGLMLTDEQVGPFRIDIRWIEAELD